MSCWTDGEVRRVIVLRREQKEPRGVILNNKLRGCFSRNYTCLVFAGERSSRVKKRQSGTSRHLDFDDPVSLDLDDRVSAVGSKALVPYLQIRRLLYVGI